jgi:hypothetical protein
MKHVTLLVILVSSLVWLDIHTADAHSLPKRIQFADGTQCLQASELSETLTTLKKQSGEDVGTVSRVLLSKARTSSSCRIQVVQALIRAMDQASKDASNQNEKIFLWENGASLLTELRATEALDLLIENIGITDGLSISISHYPALGAILKIGQPAIPKLQIALNKESEPYRRKFAAFAIAYIGGSQARRALANVLPSETDPCVKNFLRISLQSFDNKEKPNHVSSALNGEWLSAFYCR